MSYAGRIVQYLGRVSRTAPGKTNAVVYGDQRLSRSTLPPGAAASQEG